MANPTEVVGKVAVTKAGAISYNGEPTTLEKLRAQLAQLRQANGAVWYYREAAEGEPPPEAMEVVKLVIENRLPISMSTKPDYSDVVLPDGTVKPRGGARP